MYSADLVSDISREYKKYSPDYILIRTLDREFF